MKQTKLLSTLLAFLVVFSTQLHAMPPGDLNNVPHPPLTLTGTVLDNSTHEPLAGASIQVKNASTGTSTDKDGKFTLQVDNENATIVVSFSNYITQEIALKNQKTIVVELSRAVTNMNEVVVIGYGTQKKGDVTSAVSSVKSENFVKGAVRDAAQLIQGKVAGLSVSTS
ncbi:MAG TPA: carboxypeptidase-like regulatory domain-containing protein, partial [Flavitalea sp.]|nr:carboxypeptidase-like regulatory domain-containing protein [Flavitalea sp.]